MGGSDGITVSLEHQSEEAPSSNPGLVIDRQKAHAGIPLYKKESGSSLNLLVRGERTLLGESLFFSDRNVRTPREFGTAELGLAWHSQAADGARESISGTIGSAGKRLLDNGRSPIFSATYLVEKKKAEGRSWIYVLSYSNNRAFLNNIPLPGIAYVKNEKQYTLVLGLPFLFGNLRVDPWHLSASLSPWSASIDTAYRFYGPLMFYTNVKWQPKAYENLVEDSDDRFIFEKKEWGTGLRAAFGRKGSVSIGYVYNFDRRFMLGESIRDKNSDTIEIGDSGGVQILARGQF